MEHTKENFFKYLINNNKLNKNLKLFKELQIPESYSWCSSKTEYIFAILNNLTTKPICEICNKNYKFFKSFKDGYIPCSEKCKYQLKTKQKILNEKEKFQIKHTKENFLKYLINDKNHCNSTKYLIHLEIPAEYSWCKTKSHYVHSIINVIKINPICPICNSKKLSFISYSEGYKKYCSTKCSQNDFNVKKKQKETLKKKYGVDNISKLDSIKEQKEKTTFKNYGVNSPLQSKIIKEKMIKTIKNKYGVDNISKLDNIKEQKKKTTFKNYGVNTPLQSETIKEKMIKTIKNKYGVDNISKLDNIKEQKKKTTFKNYGVNNPFQSKIIKEKIKQNNIKKWGVEFPIQNLKVLNKIQKTNLIKYGNICTLQSNKQRLIIKKQQFLKMKKKLKYFDLKLNCSFDDYQGTLKYYKEKKLLNYNYYDFTCLKCNNVFKGHLVDGNIPICRKCTPILSGYSKAEKEIFKFCLTLDKNSKNNDRRTINPLELDIISNNQLAIEYNGLYYHSYQKLNENRSLITDKQIKMFKDRKLSANYGYNLHLLKTLMCEEQNIQLFHINENEWLEKKDIVKSMISSKLGFLKNKYNGRSCIIKELDSNITKTFLNNNHIQGNSYSKIKLGLFTKDKLKLVSVMTFSKKRFQDKKSNFENEEYELVRFCNLKNTIVHGAAAKLFKFFIRNYCKNNDKVITYADKRYSQGKLYNTLGFHYIHTSKPNYKYFKNLKVYNRQKFQKKKIKEYYDIFKQNKINSINYGLIKKYQNNLTEYELMLLNGFDKIFDCGQMRFEYIVKK